MKLDHAFVRLPFRFDAGRLAAEVAAIDESEWLPHPQGFKGNTALLLVSAGGDPRDDALVGDMRPTPVLARMPYLAEVMASLRSPIGRSRLMRIDEHEEVQPHADMHWYWREHLRVHVPITTDPSVEFVCGGESTHMGEGECWVFDTWREHMVRNPSSRRRVHLVADTRGSPWLWRHIRAAAAGSPLAVDEGEAPPLVAERRSHPVVMSPLELADHVDFLLAEVERDSNAPQQLGARLRQGLPQHLAHWRGLWQRFGASEAGWPHFRKQRDLLAGLAGRIPEGVVLGNGCRLREVVSHWLVDAVLHPELADEAFRGAPAAPAPAEVPDTAFRDPVFIVAAPRSGSTLLFETLARAPGLWTVGGESHQIIEGIPALSPAAHDWHSNRLDAGDASADTVAALRARFAAALRDREGRPWRPGTGPVCMLEKTPKNALRIPFLAAAFPGARFVYLVREPMANVSSILEAWRSGHFVTYDKLPDWSGGRWSLLLTPGWRELAGKSLAEVAQAQYRAAHEAILDDLAALPRDRWTAIGYESLLEDPAGEVERVSDWLGVAWDRPPPLALPASATTLSAPRRGKWRANEALLAPFAEALAAQARRIEAATGLRIPPPEEAAPGQPPAAPDATATPRAAPAPVMPAPEPAPEGGPSSPVEADAPGQQPDARTAAMLRQLASVHTASFAEVMRRVGGSLAVSTYQAGKLVFVRPDGDRVNTSFKPMPKPMGIALRGPQLAVGTAQEIALFQDLPANARRLDPSGRTDACWIPRGTHVTGNIDIHEMAFAGGELWAVNTRFCCLATFDAGNSFVPRWRPWFLTALAPEDRCHLNGLAVVGDRVKYVTALGTTDTPGGWRADKASGGVLIDVEANRIVCEGLSMPHSPRWYREQLWVLESGNGGLCRIDPATGRKETMIELPGFTRGLDFAGPLAFVGLSQVRESAVFAKLPLTERLSERNCGVWVVNIERGELVGFLRFEEAVQEIFAVNLLPGARWPELALPGDPLVADAFVLPDEALREVPAAQRVVA